MMKNFKLREKIKISLFLTISILAFSCQREDVNPISEVATESNNRVYVKDGLLVFKSYEDFEEVLRTLKRDQNKLDHWESQFDEFLSMRSAFLNINEAEIQLKLNYKNNNLFTVIENDGELEARMNIDDYVLATLVNSEGLLQIGNDAYKIDYNKLYKVSAHKISLLRDLAKSSNSEIQISDVSHRYAEYDVNGGDIQLKGKTICEQKYKKNNKSRRLKGEQWTTHIGSLYSGAGARTKHQKKSFGIWFRNKTKQLRLRVEGSYVQIIDGVRSPIFQVNIDSGWQNDDGREAYLYDFCLGLNGSPNCYFEIQSMHSIHECTCDSNNYLKCEIQR